jgi:septal ring factor EnvC (AmiA/AmiB activator)
VEICFCAIPFEGRQYLLLSHVLLPGTNEEIFAPTRAGLKQATAQSVLRNPIQSAKKKPHRLKRSLRQLRKNLHQLKRSLHQLKRSLRQLRKNLHRLKRLQRRGNPHQLNLLQRRNPHQLNLLQRRNLHQLNLLRRGKPHQLNLLRRGNSHQLNLLRRGNLRRLRRLQRRRNLREKEDKTISFKELNCIAPRAMTKVFVIAARPSQEPWQPKNFIQKAVRFLRTLLR